MATAFHLTAASLAASSALDCKLSSSLPEQSAVAVSLVSPPVRQNVSRRLEVSCAALASAAVDTYAEVVNPEEEYYEVPVHTVTVRDRLEGVTYTFQVPEDQYILQTGEEEGISLPFACRHGCCTACAVRVKSGNLSQPRALGISPELKEQGYALLCVGIPLSDLEVETQDEDEVYWLQFGRYFAKGPVERDDFALELAVADE